MLRIIFTNINLNIKSVSDYLSKNFNSILTVILEISLSLWPQERAQIFQNLMSMVYGFGLKKLIHKYCQKEVVTNTGSGKIQISPDKS